MSAAAAIAAPRDLAVLVRAANPGDLAFLSSSWSGSMQLSTAHRRSPHRHYRRDFDETVRTGILAEPDTRVLVGCDPESRATILCWGCYTPGIPTVHWCYTRPTLDGMPLRRRGLMGILVSAMGVRDGGALAYTARPQEHTHKHNNRRVGLEDALLVAAEQRGITVRYQSARDFLGR